MELGTVLRGYAIIGSIVNPTPDNIGEIGMIVTGVMDDSIRAVAKHRFGCGDEDPRVSVFLDNIKYRAKILISQIFEMAEKEDEKEQKRQREERMRALSKPHSAGTTAEIAAMLNLSKAQIRKHKADGTLDGLIAIHQLESDQKNV